VLPLCTWATSTNSTLLGGRVADASPVIGVAWWWHGWQDSDYNQLAAALVAGHLIECSTYLTGSNFCNFFQYPLDDLCFVGPPIAEIAVDGTTIVTKHESFKGYVTEDTVRCQLLYELQGNIYLNSDVTADLATVLVKEVGKNRYGFKT
jgi:Acyclic terpene utilisation family protein AtuA